MSQEFLLLLWTAAAIGFIHTLLGPDHYLPFVVMAKARGWSYPKTALITFLCGIGHVMGSVLLGSIGIMLGLVVSRLEVFEFFRGQLAAWSLIAFGIVYFIWGVRKAIKNKPHTHSHIHDNIKHTHTHKHTDDHSHIHLKKDGKDVTPWVLFTIFVFGPCEPLIPILMYPAAKDSIAGMSIITFVFGVITISTMLAVVSVLFFGVRKIPLGGLARYSHALVGLTIFLCGGMIQFLGL